jgi:isoleucyl-tRNA synthetase
VIGAYRRYEFHRIYQTVHNFCIVDMGGLYLDVLKDRLYTMPKQSPGRRSAQTALYHIAESMVRWLAPILSFTAEEIWRFIPGKRAESVFLTTWHPLPEVPKDDTDWPALIELRGDVMRELEKLRVAGTIGAPLEAEVDVYCSPQEFARFNTLGDELRFLFITSAARVHKVDSAPSGADIVPCTHGGAWIRVTRTDAAKCVRCWHRRADVGSNAAHPELCARCVTNVDGPGETRRFA